MTNRFVIYGTAGCHLCDEAETQLIQVLELGPRPFEWQAVDIAYDDRLFEKYGLIIPVVVHPASGRELGWPFSKQDLQDFVFSPGEN